MGDLLMKLIESENEFRCSFMLMGEPVAKGRPRSRIVTPRQFGKKPFVQVYPDPKTVAAEKVVKQAAALAMGSQKPFTGPLAMAVSAYVSIPASWPKGKKTLARNGLVYPHG